MHTIGIDIGGTHICAGRVDERGSIVARAECATPPEGAEAVAAEVARLCVALAADFPVDAVGVGVAGMVDQHGDTVHLAPNLGWRSVPLRALLSDRVAWPVVVLNDANAAGWAEFTVGAGRGKADALMVTVGTGIGGAVLAGGKLVLGAFGSAAELGHFRLVPDGRECGCGARGCVEQYASGTAVLRGAALHPDLRGLSIEQLERRAGAGDAAVTSLIAEAGTALGTACASIAVVTDPECIIVGGGLSRAGDVLLEPMRAAFRRARPGGADRPAVSIVRAEWGNDAGMLGAALYARGGTHAQYSGETL